MTPNLTTLNKRSVTMDVFSQRTGSGSRLSVLWKLAGLAAAGLVCAPASATWSILMVDTRTGEIAVGSATCVPGINLRASTPVLLLGRGAVTAQSAVDTSGANRARIYAGFARGLTLDEIFAELEANDNGHANRQYGFVDASGDALTYSGPQNADWAGGVTGRIEAGAPGPEGDIVYSVQGNILTGEPVVAMAEQAIVSTPGDLAEKLMAGMEAAYAFGGDGRCSCASNDPTGCGAPPKNGFVNTADVGYMLVGRLGDRDQSGSFDYTATPVGRSVFADFDEDGKTDFVHFPDFFGDIVYRRNVTPGAGGPPVFDATELVASASPPDYEAAGDIDGDGDTDVVYLANGLINTLLNNGDGTFAAEVSTGGVNGADDGVLGEFDASSPGLEIAVLAASSLYTYTFDASGSVTLVNSQLSAARDPAESIGAIPGGVLLYSLFDNGFLPFAANGDGSFTEGETIDWFFTGDDFSTGDLNGDGDFDIVYTSGPNSLAALLSDGMGGYSFFDGIGVYDPGPQFFRDYTIADTDGDGDDDIAMLARFGRFAIATDDGAGGIVNGPARRIVQGRKISAGDVTGDGLPEFVSSEGSIVGVYVNDGSGIPADAAGFAGGDYFLELNVAGSPDAGYDDPVLQLRDEFDAWRAGWDGEPDGTRSVFVQSPDRVQVAGSETGPYLLTVELRDYEGDLVEAFDGAGRFEIVAPPGEPRLVEVIGAAPTAAAGTWIVTVQPTGATGSSDLWLRIDTDQGPTVILPAPSIVAGQTLADLAEPFGVLDLQDLVAFVTAFTMGDLAVDLNDDGVLDLDDVSLFVTEFQAG